MDENFDVVVVGCGVAGLSAAVSAAQRGLNVCVLERATRAERGGQSRFTEAYLRMKSLDEVSDDFEEHLGENASRYPDPDLMAEMALDRSSWSQTTASLALADADVLSTFAAYVPPSVQWLRDMGVRFDFLPTQFLTRSQPRLLPVGGGEAMVEALAAQAEALGVTFHYECTARELIVDTQGSVAGLTAWKRGAGRRRYAGAVVLACGGFEGNPEMLAQYLGPRSVYLRPVCKGGYYNKGEGIAMALRAGAAPSGEFGSYHAEPVDPRSGVSEPSIFVFPYGILVNKRGQRFTDEAPGTVDAWYERVTRRIYDQDEGIAYVILDQRVKDIPNYRLAIRTDQPAIEAPTLEALAAKLGVPAEALTATVAAYNSACREGHYDPLATDGLTTHGLEPRKSNWALPVDRAPFFAYPIISANVFTFGGLKVDAAARVLNADGAPIPGLYAAGETIGMYYGNYTGATSVLKGLVFGKLAGETIASRC
ncbi:FAD-dependent oxidoreductase [Paraburkholderia heleia]|uniref:FAD-dependent oxidoreductase n=1 Tax=Paraburkholderia heleia TaxID=634127 RepID=UPI0031D6B535